MKPQLRAAVIARDEGRCQAERLGLAGTYCRDLRDVRGTERKHSVLHVHHIWPTSQGGTDAVENLITLCAFHHKDEHRRFSKHFVVAMAARVAS